MTVASLDQTGVYGGKAHGANRKDVIRSNQSIGAGDRMLSVPCRNTFCRASERILSSDRKFYLLLSGGKQPEEEPSLVVQQGEGRENFAITSNFGDKTVVCYDFFVHLLRKHRRTKLNAL
ncbi:hypothetical protein HQ34_05575 [Porphyromonas cangingivalis]|nr:hypothetical protein HQ34_05575 [Porphyromonas cangingivalis]